MMGLGLVSKITHPTHDVDPILIISFSADTKSSFSDAKDYWTSAASPGRPTIDDLCPVEMISLRV